MENKNESIFAGNNDNVASENKSGESTTTNTNTNNLLDDSLKEIVGEGKKYKSVEDALKSVPHAQKHISDLENELKVLKETLSKSKTAEELVNSIKADRALETTKDTKQDIDLSNIEALVENKLKVLEEKKIQDNNVNKVINVFKENFGDKANDIYIKIAKDSGLDINTLNQLSAKSPDAVLKLAGLTGKSNETLDKISKGLNSEGLININKNKAEPKKSVMYGATSSDLLNAWNLSKPKDI